MLGVPNLATMSLSNQKTQTDSNGFVFSEEEKQKALAERELENSMGEVRKFGKMVADHCIEHSEWTAYVVKQGPKKGEKREAGSIDTVSPSLISELLMKASPRGYSYNGKLVKFCAGGNYGKSVKVQEL